MAHKDAPTKLVFEGVAGMSRFYDLALQVFQGEEKSSRLRAAKTGEGFYCLAAILAKTNPSSAAALKLMELSALRGYKPANRALKSKQFLIEEMAIGRLCALLHAAAEEGNNDAAIALALGHLEIASEELGMTGAAENWLRRAAEAGRGEGMLLLGLQLLPRMQDCCDEMISWLERGLGLQGQVVWEEVQAAKVALAKGYIHRLRATDDDACADILRGETLGKVDEILLAAFLVRLHRRQVRMPHTQAVIERALRSSARMRVLMGAYFLAEEDCERSREWLTKAMEVESTRAQAERLLLVERVVTRVQRDEYEEAKKGVRELLKVVDLAAGDLVRLFLISLGISRCIGCAASNQQVREAWSVPRRCMGCSLVYYCSTQCQERHWADGHKKVCREWKDAKVLPNDAVAHALVELRVRARQLHEFLVRSTDAGGVACGPGFVDDYTKLSDVLQQKEKHMMDLIKVRDQAKTAIRAR